MSETSPISLGVDDGASIRPTELGHQLIARWLGAHQRPYTQANGVFVTTIPAAEDEKPIQIRIGLTPRPIGILFSAMAMVRYDRESWAEALATCNQWNGQFPTPKARLAIGSWADDADAPVALESWLPLDPATTQVAVNTMGDALVRGALGFWRPAPDAT